MEKVRLRIYQLTLALTLISLALVLVSSGKQREFFYIAVYASIIGLVCDYKSITLRPFSIALPILLIGLLNVAWYFTYEYHNEGINFYSDYLGAGKKLILGSVLVFYIDSFRHYVSSRYFQRWLLLATGTGFVLATGFAFWQAMHGMDRVEMGINRATLSAYLYSMLSLAFVYSLFIQRTKIAYALAGLVIIIAYAVVLLTGTRAAMGLYLVVTLLVTLFHFRKIHLKPIIMLLCVLAGLIALSYKPLIAPKIAQTQTEITRFQDGQDATSLGARFSMWTVGIANGLNHPLGQSMEERGKWTGEYVKKHPHLASSMIFMNVHLHNEFIEKYSLQGIPGIILLMFFFVSLLWQGLKHQNGFLLTATLLLLGYGLTDVILLSSEGVIFFITVFALSSRIEKNSS